MGGVDIKINGLDRVVKNMNSTDRHFIAKELNVAITRSILMIERTAKQLVPVDTSNLQHSISSTFKDLYAFTQPKANYANFVEFGTSKMRAKPYMIPAAEQSKPFIQEEFDKAIDKITNNLTK